MLLNAELCHLQQQLNTTNYSDVTRNGGKPPVFSYFMTEKTHKQTCPNKFNHLYPENSHRQTLS